MALKVTIGARRRNPEQSRRFCKLLYFPQSRPVYNGLQLRLQKNHKEMQKHCGYLPFKTQKEWSSPIIEEKKSIKQIKPWQCFLQSGMVHDSHLCRLHPLLLSFQPKGLWRKSPKWKLRPDHVVKVKQKTHKSEMGAAKKDPEEPVI